MTGRFIGRTVIGRRPVTGRFIGRAAGRFTGRTVIAIALLFGFGASRGFALVGGLAGALLCGFGCLPAVLVGDVVAILVGPGVRLRVVVAGAVAA
jgi:hypothetical protein